LFLLQAVGSSDPSGSAGRSNGRRALPEVLSPLAATPGAAGVVQQQQGQVPMVLIARPLPRVLLLHTGGTLGMDASESYEQSLDGHMVLKQASWLLLTGRSAAAGLQLLHSL
jgi:hypothetical protein